MQSGPQEGKHRRQVELSNKALRIKHEDQSGSASSDNAPSLADDLLRDLDEIQEYTGEKKRRLRHLIAQHGFPAGKVGGRFQARRSKIDAYYAERLG